MNMRLTKTQSIVEFLAGAIIALGILLRIVMWLYNRDLWIDEASVARNVYERDFLQLVRPLDYYQYAPPVYLCIVKGWAALLGYSEYVLRLHSLICGVGSLLLLCAVAKKVSTVRAALYPLFLIATGFIFLRYATELKQYMSDSFIALLLVWLALYVDIEKTVRAKFILIWVVTGSLAIWSSMPSVFVLAGIGLYYAVKAIKNGNTARLLPVGIAGAVWVSQFLIYYFLILKPQINSDYLQNYHNRFFLFATPGNAEEWVHNKDVLVRLLSVAGGTEWYAILFNAGLIIAGGFVLARKNIAQALLFLSPVAFMLCAAMLNQYSLIPRLTLFSMPLLFILMAVAIEKILSAKYYILKLTFLAIAICCAVFHQAIATLYQPFEQEKITRGFEFLKEKGLQGKDIFVAVGADHAFLYYTDMHPGRSEWQSLKGATLMQTNTGFDSLAQTIKEKKAFLYTIVFDSYEGKKQLDKALTLTDSFDTEGCHVYIYNSRQKATP